MANFASTLKRVLFVMYLLCVHAVLVYLLVDKYVLQRALVPNWKPEAATDPSLRPSPFPTPAPETTPIPGSAPEPETPNPQAVVAKIIVPVAGVKPEQLVDTFTQSRSEGRTHDAIDIMAPGGTPVLAAADGEIVKFFDSDRGGITIYQISTDRKYFFYYAHLQRRADGISEHQSVKIGTVIGYVGDTGNAGPGNYHLHFAISVVSDPKRFWDGIAVNPYEILKGQAELK
jgi:murein DD-endopeptidase MepM/ murein hydrolase activator NlpD